MAATIKFYWVSRAGTMYVTDAPKGTYACGIGAPCLLCSDEKTEWRIDRIDLNDNLYRCRERDWSKPYQAEGPTHEHSVTNLAVEVSRDGKALVQLLYPYTRYEGRERTQLR